ncbi:NUDIX hydrolase [Nocardioides limicola]|uniref:NUDIX hydrolase n=1 Tax=Nocardioides limicola TaxID=2803368 RepID=UPI00193C378F|nr:NUDIX hydrolase [Nocardioides sp. DJM-14]
MGDIEAAGAVVLGPSKQVLVVHRPKYDDWSFPKGKIDKGEHRLTAAVREVAEETGLQVRLGPPLSTQHYSVGGRGKNVHYWTARVVGDDDVSRYRPNLEIDKVRWVHQEQALGMLSYDHDRATLKEAMARRARTQALVVLRHGRTRALALVPLLAAYDVAVVASSPAVRCTGTVRPYAEAAGWPIAMYDGLSEQLASPGSVASVLDDLIARGDGAVLCTHRPVLPQVFAALGIPPTHLEPGGFAVVHLRGGRVAAVEVHAAS